MKARSLAAPVALACLLVATRAAGWGAPHGTITQAALDALPAWQREALGPEREPLGRLYCIIPDLVYTRKDLAPYAAMDSRPGVLYISNLHLPGAPAENYEILRYFVGRAAGALQTNALADAARYAGTLAHFLEDWSCPAHSVPGDNMFTLFKQFLPPTEDYRYTPLHGPIEGGTFAVSLAGYRPQLLGATPDEAAFNLLRRAQEGTVFARGQVIPIIQSLYAGDTNACNAAQQKAGEFGARLVADALYTVISLGRSRADPAEAAALASVDLSAFAPQEAPALYLPQTAFFSKPYWGHAVRGAALKDGKEPVPLRLLIPAGGKAAARELAAGLSVGTRCSLSYLVPPGVYARVTAWAGLHAELGASGHVTFEVLGNGRSLARFDVRGGEPAQAVSVPLEAVTNLQLTATSAARDSSGNYAVWGEPRLVRAGAAP
jgi:hypothetical protein